MHFYLLLSLFIYGLKTKIMASCEKCWNDAQGRAEDYQQLIEERRDNPCTPEEQAGEEATECSKCNTMTMHQYAKVCTKCGSK